jgi:hypothetical protein
MVSWNFKHVQHVKIYLPQKVLKSLQIGWKKGNNSKMGNQISFKIAG